MRQDKCTGAPSLSPKVELWALEAHVHKTTYGPLVDTALYVPVMLLMRENPILGQVEGVGPWKSQLFGAPNATCLTAQCHFTGLKISLDFQGSTPSHLPS